MTAGLPEGSQHSLKDIKAAASNDPAYQNMSKAEKDQVRTQLQSHHNLKATAARESNTSVAKDVASTMSIQECEVHVLFIHFLLNSLLTSWN
jgi:hypothetical protein